MSSAAATLRPAGFASVGRAALRLIPGLALLLIIGLAGKLAQQQVAAFSKANHLALPDIEYVLWAIVFGLIISNIIGVPRFFESGVATYEFWLKAGIVLLGARFIFGDVMRLGAVSLVLVAVEIAVAIVVMTLLARAFHLRPKLGSLLAVGSAICGVSAIIAARGAIDADDEDSSIAIAAILALGAVGLFTFPLIGHALGMGDHAYGLWAGLAIDNTAEVTAAGSLYSDEAARFAVLAKTVRNATIGFVVLAYAVYWASRGQAKEIGSKGLFLWQKLPKFVLGFLLISFFATVGTFSGPQLASLGNLSRWAFLLTFAGVGLRTDLRKLTRQGLRPFAVGALGELAIAVFTLGLVWATASLVTL